jgi:preprotein translocase subunit YajC
MNTQEYIDERMKEYSMNIDEFSIGEEILDSDGIVCKITDKTSNSIEVEIKKKNKEGVDHKQWFDMKRFNNRFKVNTNMR